MKRLFYLIAVMLYMGLVSCGKDGSIGPEGPRGEQGERGANGQDGADGRTVLNGNTDPTAEQGSVGDFYINTSSYVLFGPKTSSGWGSGESILGAKGDKGDKGDKGEADYVILSGTSNPTSSIGKAGDFYYNTTAKTLHYRTSSWSRIAKLANTIQFTKTGVSLGSTTATIDINIPYDVFENSMVQVYVKISSAWFPLPGYIAGMTSYFTVYFTPVNFSDGRRNPRLHIYRNTGTASTTNATIRIVVTEADVFHTVAKTVDFNNYEQVKQHFKLKD